MLRNNYKETIEEEYLEVIKNDSILKIFKISNILSYYNLNNYVNINHKWEKKTFVDKKEVNDLFDINLEFEVSSIEDSQEIKDFNEGFKKFRLIKNFTYDLGNGIIAIARIVKSNDNEFKDLKKSKILTSSQKYEFELVIHNFNEKNILSNIILIMKSIFMSNIILTKKQQQDVLNDYEELIKKDMNIPPYYKEVPLLTPKPVTLERRNLNNPDEYGSISILRDYVVTEKADGERMLMYVNNEGNIYLISSSLKVEDTGLKAMKGLYNSLIDGEYVTCNKRIDNVKRNLYASFDIYYLNGKSLTSLPLVEKGECRNKEMLKIPALIKTKDANMEFIVKIHREGEDILKECNEILSNPHNYPYEIDGLIFTPAKLAVYSFYPSIPVPITQNMSWDRLFKWKPPEQNTIDFLVKSVGDIRKDGLSYKKLALYVGSNPITTKDISIDEGLRLRYDRDYNKQEFLKTREMIKNKEDFIPIPFKPIIYYHPDVEYAFMNINSKGEMRAENGDLITTDMIVEFRYNLDEKRWIAIRVREDKTKIYKKGIFSKTANSLPVAMNVWHSIHNPISTEMIMGNALINADNLLEGKPLEADDVYYSRGIPRRYLLSYNMLVFHNIGINEKLFMRSKNKGSLLELACGQASDLSRWLNSGYKFVLGVDLSKDNIYKANDGAYARMLKEYARFNKDRRVEKGFFPNIAFAAGDCGIDIRSGDAGVDEESKELLRIIMNPNQNKVKPYYKHIASKGAGGFDVITCMFAIHYLFSSEEVLNGFIGNVSNNLKKGGIFIATFMDGGTVERAINENGGQMVEGKKLLGGKNIPIWAIIKRFVEKEGEVNMYNRKVDIFIENTQRLIPEYLVSFEFLVDKMKEFGLELEETELYRETFEKMKANIPKEEEKQSSLDKTILELDKEELQKKFSFMNRWTVFKKV
jgi:2-polyprenyl-3-methyl-5-hydroxy-6-metoxy-1,4-benzoquinol methylase